MSLHHVLIFHGSEPNRGDDCRIGLAIRYIPTRLSQLARKDTATLVRGVDRYGHFLPEPRPQTDRDPACMAFHAAMQARTQAFLFAGVGAAG